MTCAMRILAILMVAALTAPAARCETLSAADREALLDNLDKLRDAAGSKVDARFHTAMTAYREAMASDGATLELHLKCIEKVNFLDQQKKPSEYLEWKHKDDVKAQHADPAFRLALRYQLRWLALTLQASSENANLKTLATEAQEIVDALFRDADKLAGQEKLLQTAVTATEFAKAYEIGDLKKDKWPLSAIHLEEIYGTIVFPPLRTPARVARGFRGTDVERRARVRGATALRQPEDGAVNVRRVRDEPAPNAPQKHHRRSAQCASGDG